MVGVAGKSQGCNTCRKRRVKCDRRGIPCGPCLKSRKVCTGYTRDRLFKNLSALDRDSLLSRSQPLVPITEPLVLRHGSEDSSSSRCSNPESLTYTPPSAREIDPEPRSFTFLFARFMNEYIPTKSEGKAATSEPPVTWLQALPQIQANYPSLNNAIAALSMVRLGRMDNDEKLKQGGISVYSKALEGMQEMLSGNDLLYKEQTLASCLTMSIFEVLETSGENVNGWIAHIQGISRLFQIRGPALHDSGLSHLLFLGYRPTGIIHALSIRKSTYLGDQEWLGAPWINIQKSPFHHLLDIMAEIPSLLEQTEKSFGTVNPPSNLTPCEKQSYDFEERLHRWYNKQASESSEKFGYTSKASWVFNTQQRNWDRGLFAESLDFENFEYARMHHFYWAALLLIYINIANIHREISNFEAHENNLSSHQSPPSNSLKSHPLSSPPEQQPLPTPLQSKMLEDATMIAMSIPYLLSEEAHMQRPQIVFFPLRLAQHIFSQLSHKEKEEKWCKDVFGELDERGYAFGKILSGVKWDDIPRFLCGEMRM